MLPRDYRLARSTDITQVFRRGETVFGKGLLVKYMKKAADNPRVAVLVGTKVAKRANVRNRIKRRLREVVRLNLASLPVGYDLLIVARTPKLRETDYTELTQNVLDSLKQIPSRDAKNS